MKKAKGREERPARHVRPQPKERTRARPTLGMSEWFRAGERERAERVLRRLGEMGVTELRTGISWADWMRPGGPEWYDWLLPRLRKQVSVLPCVARTPPALGLADRTNAPPKQPKAYADYLDIFLSRYGELFDAIELWEAPDATRGWDRTLDPEWAIFCDVIGKAAHWVRRCGKLAVLGAVRGSETGLLKALGEHDVLRHLDVIGLRRDGPSHETREGWDSAVARATEMLRAHGSEARVWLTVGRSTWPGDGRGQAEALLEAMAAPVERVYWAAVEDAAADAPEEDARRLRTGVCGADGRPKVLGAALSEGGVGRAADVLSLHGRAAAGAAPDAALITGGCGFIGTNLADRLANEGRRVIALDSLARPGVERNARYLKEKHGDLVEVWIDDVRDRGAVREAVQRAREVYHLAAQVAVTTSLDSPEDDLDVNIRGTLTLLEEVRRAPHRPPVVFTSTNKVYGGLGELLLSEKSTRYVPLDRLVRTHGISEYQPLEFCSPYGCSKGAADQYVLDYGRSYGVPTVVFRMSCIYGPHQCGTEDQGWISHFLMAAARGRTLTIYGDGKQVRDALHVSDLVDAFLIARRQMAVVRGQAFNIGGGPENAISLLELLELMGRLNGERPEAVFGEWRTGDQRWYVTDTRAFHAATGWSARIGVREGVRRVNEWLRERTDGARTGARLDAAAVTP